MTIYSLDILLSLFGTSLLFHVWFSLEDQTQRSMEQNRKPRNGSTQICPVSILKMSKNNSVEQGQSFRKLVLEQL